MPSTILPASTLKCLSIKGVNCVQVFWSTYHAYSLNATRALEPFNPQHKQSKRRWEARTDSLWWNCLISTKAGGNKRVVRNWLARRGRVAITNALNRRGYAKDGASLTTGSESSNARDLVGSANILVCKSMLRTSFEDLEKQADRIVEAFVRMQELETPRARRQALKEPLRRARHHGSSFGSGARSGSSSFQNTWASYK